MQVRVKALVDSDVSVSGEVMDIEMTPFVRGLVASKVLQVLGVSRSVPPGPGVSAAEWRAFLRSEGIQVDGRASLRHMRELWGDRG